MCSCGRAPEVMSGTFSRMRDEVSSPYQRSREPAALRMAYLEFRMNSSRVESSVFVVTDLWMMQNLKVPTVEGP